MTPLLLGWLFGLAQGLRHAFEPDHLAAVSTVVAEQRSARASMTYAATWGLGHALVLVAVGGALFVARREMPDRLAHGFELGVAVMLVALGLRGIRSAIRARRAEHVHVHAHGWKGARRPLLIGVVHGLAGSGALTAIVASSFGSAASGLLFMAIYGAGAALGMALLAGAVGVPLARAMRTRWGATILLGTTGVFSLVLGFVWGWPIVHAMTLR